MIIVKVQIGDRGEILRSLPGRRDVIEIAIIVIVTRVSGPMWVRAVVVKLPSKRLKPMPPSKAAEWLLSLMLAFTPRLIPA